MPKEKPPIVKRVVSITGLTFLFLIIMIISSSGFAQSSVEPFSIDVTVNYIELDLQTVGGYSYFAWWVSEVFFGDTIGMDVSEAVHLINGSNVPVDLFSDIIDYPDSTTSDTLWTLWEIALHGGRDSVGFRWASEPTLTIPPFSEAQVILSTSSLVENEIPAGENRYLFGWLLAPTEGDVGERHRLLSNITITPAMVP